jgi:hypothetical protein
VSLSVIARFRLPAGVAWLAPGDHQQAHSRPLLFSAGLFRRLHRGGDRTSLGHPLAGCPARRHARLIGDINPLVMAFAIVNLLVAATLNPWKLDRLPDRFPSIVQDSLIIVLFSLVAVLILRDRVLTTTAVGAVVLASRCRTRSAICLPAWRFRSRNRFVSATGSRSAGLKAASTKSRGVLRGC